MEEKTEKPETPPTEGEEDKEKKSGRGRVVSDAEKKRLEKEYEEYNRRRRERGEKIEEEEIKEQKRLIEKGVPIISGGAGDGNFENFDPARFESNDSLRELAIVVKRAGEQSRVTEEFLADIRSQLNNRVGLGLVSEDESRRFDAYLNEFVIVQNAENRQNNTQEERMGDEHFENFNAYLFANTPLEALANEIVEVGRSTRRVPDTTVDRWANSVREMGNRGEIEANLLDLFSREFGGTLRERQDDEGRANRENRERRDGEIRQTNGEGGARRPDERLENTPRSIQEICRWIINKEGDVWDIDGANALLDREGRFNKGNFLKWVRERMLHFHNLDPDNPQLNLLGSVGIETEFKTIGVISMINNKKQYFRDEKPDPDGKDVVYSDFADELLNEVYLFQTSRNHDANYRATMWKDEELPGLIDQLHAKNDFTKATQLKKIFSFSSGDYGEDTKVGDSIRKAYEIYYNISDYEELQKILTNGGEVFFTRKLFEDALRMRLDLPHDADSSQFPEGYRRLFGELFDANGNAKPKDFIDFINLFNVATKDQSTVDLVREAIRLSLSKMYGLENGLDDMGEKRVFTRKNLEYAEAWAYSMARWTGAAGRNDTTSIGYDAFTKVLRFQQYRLRQSKAGRGGQFGNEYDLPPIKQMTLDFFNGVFVEKDVGESRNFTPFEIIKKLGEIDTQDISEEEKKRTKDEWLDRIKFKQFAQLDYASNHVGRGYKVFHSMLGAEELKIDEIVKYEPFRGYVLDRAKFEQAFKEDFIKPIRYAFQTYANIDYTKKIRVQTNPTTDPNVQPVYEEMTYAEAMFGPEVLQGFYKRDKRGRIERNENGRPKLDEEKLVKNRSLIYKRVARAILAGRIRAHRERFSGYNKMDFEQMQMFYHALRSIREIDLVTEEEKTQVNPTEHFFTEADIKWMRKYSGTESWRMALTDISPRAMWGFTKGMSSGLRDWFKSIIE